MQQPSEPTTRLTVRAPDSLTEVSVSDGRFRKIDSAMGDLSVSLPPGIYRVRWSGYSSEKQQLVEIRGDEPDGEVIVAAKAPMVATSAPISGSKFGHVDHPEALSELSGGTPLIGEDEPTQLMVVLRDPEATSAPLPVDAVSLYQPSGELIMRLSKGRHDVDARFAGMMVGLPAGVYRLRINTAALGDYELFVTTARQWQTQVFLICDDFYLGKKVYRRPALRSASILMQRKGTPFNPERPDARLAEQALGALLSERDILDAGDMQDMLHGKFDDPMLGIYVAHLLLKKPKVNWSLFRTVCRNLHRLVGSVPDLRALTTVGEQDEHWRPGDDDCYAGMPPMLVRSWRLLVEASRERFSTIPKGSWSDRIAASIAATRPWLVSRLSEQSATTSERVTSTSVARAKRIMAEMVQTIEPADVAKIKADIYARKTELDALESAILDIVAQTSDKERPPSLESSFFSKAMADQGLSNRAADLARGSMQKLDAPSYSVARSALSLAEKLPQNLRVKMR